MSDNFNSTIGRNDLGAALIPDEISQEIIQTMPEKSVMLTRGKRMRMSSKKKTQPVLAELPEAYWVSEGGLKQTTKSAWENVNITAEELAVLVPIPDSVREDASINLFETMKPLIAEAFGKKIDQAAIFGVDKPDTWGDDILSGAKKAKNTVTQGTGKDLAADVASLGKMLAKEGYAINGFASQPGLNWELTELRDANDRPIYTPNLTDRQPANLYGYPCNEVMNGSWDTTKAVLLAADWSKFIVGIRQDITYKIFDQGIISDTNGKVMYNAMQQDSQIMRVVMRVGFQVANPITRVAKKGAQYPAGFILPAALAASDTE
jgi:HK97 family phage major capsid protein